MSGQASRFGEEDSEDEMSAEATDDESGEFAITSSVLQRTNGGKRDVESLQMEAEEDFDDAKHPNCRLGGVEYAVGPGVSSHDNCAQANDFCCPRWFPRIGNMVVLRYSSQGESNRIDCVVGPYWPMMLCITYPLIAVISTFAGYYVFRGKHPLVIALFVLGVLVTSACLALTACSDPGILRRYRQEPPPQVRGRRHWSWNDQANTWRPAGAQYCRDCNLIIEGFDHTCPWTGTGIGRKNMVFFQSFTSACCCSLVYIFVIIIVLGVSR